jgi:predicted NBD/HSP70 family sugar kinase
MVQLEPTSGYVLSVAVARDHAEVGVANLGAEPEFVLRSDVGVQEEAERQKALDAAGALLERVLHECEIPLDRIHGIGVGVEGPVEIPTGKLHPVSPPAEPINVRAFFEKAYPWPVLVENDVNVLAMAEAWSGAARDVPDFLYVKLGGGPGVGSGMVCCGQVYHGAQGWAGEMGHVPVPGHDRRCSCGKTGCLVTIASGQALAQTALELAREGRSPFLAGLLHQKGDLTADDLVEALRERDHAAADAIQEAGNCVGQVLGTVVSLTNPALILIGGGPTGLPDLLLSAIRESVYRWALPLSARDLSIQTAKRGQEAPLVGAAAMAISSVWGMTAYGPPREFAGS